MPDRVIVTVYVLEPVELPTIIVIVFPPTFRFTPLPGFPTGTFVPLTEINALAAFVLGVTVTDVTEYATFAVYCVVVGLNAGESIPDEIRRLESAGLCCGVECEGLCCGVECVTTKGIPPQPPEVSSNKNMVIIK